MKRNRFYKGLICLAMAATFILPSTAFATLDTQPAVISSEISQFMQEYNFKRSELADIDSEDLESLISQAQAYDASEEMVANYIEGLVSPIDSGDGALEGILSEDKTFFTYVDSDGAEFTLPNRHYAYHETEEQLTEESSLSAVQTRSVGSDVENPKDQTGVYWAVKSTTGYDEATAFITLPSVPSCNSKDRPYMFLAANSFARGNSRTFIGDYGVVYMPSTGKWHPFVNVSQWDDNAINAQGTRGDYVTVKNHVCI